MGRGSIFYLTDQQSSERQAGKDGWALHDSLFTFPNVSACPARFPSQLMVSLPVMISSAWHLSVPSIANEPSPGSKERLWPWSYHLNKSVIFVSMETYIWLLSQADSQVSLPVMFFYFGIFLLNIVKIFYSRAHLFCRNYAAATYLPVCPGWCWFNLDWVSKSPSGWQAQFITQTPHNTVPALSPDSACQNPIHFAASVVKGLLWHWNFVLLNF